jgi:hypothetical protein
MTPPWKVRAEYLEHCETALVSEWFMLAETAWALGIRRTSSDLILHQVRFRLRRHALNHDAAVLARLWRERFPARESLFVYRPSRLDGDEAEPDPRQPMFPDFMGAPA